MKITVCYYDKTPQVSTVLTAAAITEALREAGAILQEGLGVEPQLRFYHAEKAPPGSLWGTFGYSDEHLWLSPEQVDAVCEILETVPDVVAKAHSRYRTGQRYHFIEFFATPGAPEPATAKKGGRKA